MPDVTAPESGAGETGGGASRAMADLTVDELLATPPSPVRSPLFAQRFPVEMEEYDNLKAGAREHSPDALAADDTLEAQTDEEVPEQQPEENPPEDELAGGLAPAASASFEGISQTAFRPPDCTVAVGPTRVMAAVNVDLVGYDKTGLQVFRWANFTAMFNPVLPAGAQLFDPKLAYDHYSGRWIVCVAARRANPQGSWIMLGVSQTGDPAGAYWIWSTDATVNGSTATGNWSDYPMLGFDTQAIYVSTNQFGFGGGFAHAKLRIFNKAELYGGGVGPSHNIRWWDFWGLKNPDGSAAFSVQPCCHFQGLGGNPRAYLVNSLFPSGSSLTLWTLSNSLGLWSGSAPTLTSTAVACRSYSLPPGAVQKDGGTTRIATNDTRLLNAVFQSVGRTQRVWTTHTSGYSWRGDTEARSVVQWYEIDVPSHAISQQGAFGASGRHYFFPVIQTDISRNAHVAFGRSAADEYGHFRQTGRLATDAPGTLQGSATVIAGQSAYTGGRWGDYFGIGRDPSDSRTVWSYGEYAGASNTWRTRVNAAKY
ncbi:hypothetical protein [Amycolatopsis jejuensis]|uniref:hypothetical protein n=1 Tax=Amycolatopsis jejuensis TaxID=330084 RepID=UPI00052697AA|nr:hypothetical protein [Amycolatopsis jejuensis]